jgi:hypothetical protein
MTNAVPRAKLETRFLEWKERLQQCINITGACVDSTATYSNQWFAIPSRNIDDTDLLDSLPIMIFEKPNFEHL